MLPPEGRRVSLSASRQGDSEDEGEAFGEDDSFDNTGLIPKIEQGYSQNKHDRIHSPSRTNSSFHRDTQLSPSADDKRRFSQQHDAIDVSDQRGSKDSSPSMNQTKTGVNSKTMKSMTIIHEEEFEESLQVNSMLATNKHARAAHSKRHDEQLALRKTLKTPEQIVAIAQHYNNHGSEQLNN